MSKTIGIIGLGIIGSVWTRHYAASGVLAGVWNRSSKPDFPDRLANPGAVAELADVVQIVVADPPAVEAVLESILPRLRVGKFVVQSSTIDPESSERFRRLVVATGAHYLEAPFVGSKSAAEARKNIYYLGGSTDDVLEVDPLLSLVSERRFHVGTGRQAAALKLAVNLNIALQMAAIGESLALARRAGIGDDAYFEVLKTNVSCSPLVKLKETKILSGDFSPQFSVRHMHKDMRLALATIAPATLPLLNCVCEQLQRAESVGFGGEDFSALTKLAFSG